MQHGYVKIYQIKIHNVYLTIGLSEKAALAWDKIILLWLPAEFMDLFQFLLWFYPEIYACYSATKSASGCLYPFLCIVNCLKVLLHFWYIKVCYNNIITAVRLASWYQDLLWTAKNAIEKQLCSSMTFWVMLLGAHLLTIL